MYYRAGGEKESVHLEDWPEAEKARNHKSSVLEEMKEVRRIVSLGLEARSKANIKVRQPLLSLKFKSADARLKSKKELLDIIAAEVNVKQVAFDGSIENEVELDTSIPPELKEEGDVREMMRGIQDLRKKAALSPEDSVRLEVETGENGKTFLEKNKADIMKATGVRSIEYTTLAFYDEVKAGDFFFKLKISK